MMADGIHLVPENRVVERKQGCWNCRHHGNIHNQESRVRQLWHVHRQNLTAAIRASRLHAWDRIVQDPAAVEQLRQLERRGIDRRTAMEVVLRERVGEDPRQGFLDKVQAEISSGKIGICQRPGGAVHDPGIKNPPGDFIYSAFLCSGWEGVQGASVSRSTDGQDLLPAELREKVDAETPDAPRKPTKDD
jgi:hypothetical protein